MNAQMIGTLTRLALAAFGGGMLAAGDVSEADFEAVIGALSTVGSIVWGVIQRRRATKAEQRAAEARVALGRYGHSDY